MSQTKPYEYIVETSWRLSLGSFLQKLCQCPEYKMFLNTFSFCDGVSHIVMGEMGKRGWSNLPLPCQGQLQACESWLISLLCWVFSAYFKPHYTFNDCFCHFPGLVWLEHGQNWVTALPSTLCISLYLPVWNLSSSQKNGAVTPNLLFLHPKNCRHLFPDLA